MLAAIARATVAIPDAAKVSERAEGADQWAPDQGAERRRDHDERGRRSSYTSLGGMPGSLLTSIPLL
jgi:hypothetical protein